MGKDAQQPLVPKLRFPQFRGMKGWEERSLGMEAQFYKGRGITKAEIQPDGSRPCIRYGELYTRYGEIIYDVFSRTNSPESRLFISKKNDVIIPASGETKEDIATASCVMLDGVALGGDLNVLRTDHNGVFLSYLINGSKRQEIARIAQGDTVVHLYPGQLKQIAFSFPSLAEQQKIAECLTSLDELIAAQARKVELLKDHKKGLMQRLFPREGERVPRLRFGGFAGEWELAKASDYVNVLQGYGFPDRLQGRTDGEFPFYKVSDISAVVDMGGVFLGDANNHVDRSVITKLRAKPLPVGTTVFAKIGEAIRSNKRAITMRPCLVDNNAAGVKAIEGKADDHFVYYLWCTISLIEYAGGVVPAVNKSAIEQISVCFPGSAEQQRIAAFLSALDDRIAAEAEKLNTLRTHKIGLMQQLFPVVGGGELTG